MGRGDAYMGVGVGLRRPYLEVLAARSDHGVPFWEIAPENVLGEGGRMYRFTHAVVERDSVLTHGLAISLGGFDPWDREYLRDLSSFLREIDTPWHSEHLCFTSVDGMVTHELLPMPFTGGAMRHAARRARELQAQLPVPLLLENITYYAALGKPEMDEATFIAEVLDTADVGWLLDINNVYVNSVNFGFDPKAWLSKMPLHRVLQMHIAGHTRTEKLLLDTHGAEVIDPVIELMQWVLRRIGKPIPVLLERDNCIPDLDDLLAERERIQAAYDEALAVPVEAAGEVHA